MKRLVVGIYAGRSGSKSLVSFLSEQPGVVAFWEETRFHTIPALGGSGRRLRDLEAVYGGIVCDVDYRWLWHLDHVFAVEDSVVIYLYRKPEEIAQSFFEYLESYGIGDEWKNYPFCGYEGTQEEVLRSVSQYHEEVDQIAKQVPNRVIQLDVEDLNNMARMNRMLDYLGVEKEGRVEKRFHIRTLLDENYAEREEYDAWNADRKGRFNGQS